LYEAAVREGVKVRFGARVENLEDSSPRPCVALSTGERIEADLIIGADGISPSRFYSTPTEPSKHP
jgi:salicylate hydroxylase